MERIYYVFSCKKPLNFVHCGKTITKKEFIHNERIMKDYMLLLVTSGTLYMEQNNIKYEVLPKQILFNLPNLIQRGYKTSSMPVSFYWLHFTSFEQPTIFDEKSLKTKIKNDKEYFNKKIIIPNQFDLINYDSLLVLISQLNKSVLTSKNQDFEDYYITLICFEITNQVIKHFGISFNTIPIKLRQITEHIKTQPYYKLKVIELAETFNYSEKYLSYLFKKHLKISPHEYIINEKTDRATALLVDTTLQVKDIAYILGFNDEHHFMRVFKKVVGISPTTYRKTFTK